MIAFATTTVAILRGADVTDSYGDPIESDNTYKGGIPASLIEKTRYVATADSSTPMIVRYIQCRLPGNIQINSDDRIRDERTGVIYSVDEYSQPANWTIMMDVRLSLKAVT